MPLLISPIDGSPMKQISRHGIEIDVCQTSGGIWLDKGELEKLMLFLKEDVPNERSSVIRSNMRGVTAERLYRRDDDDDEDEGDFYRSHRDPRTKKSKMSRMMDIFDF